MPDLSDSSRMSEMPSSFFSRDQLGDALEQRALVHLVGQLVDDDRLRGRSCSISSMWVRARITTRPRPVR